MATKMLSTTMGIIFGQRTIIPPKLPVKHQFSRNFFAYLRVAFNKVDENRLAEVGPDRLCAEWIIKNGGSVQFVNQRKPTKEYNALQTDLLLPANPKIQIVDATDSSIMAVGFEHFKGCHSINRIILHRCKHMENEALEQLVYVKNSLKELQVTDCPNVEENGLLSLRQLKALEKLTIYGFCYVNDLNGLVHQLKQDLTKCDIVSNKI